MASIAKIALLGFSRIERATFEAFFRIAGRRTPAYAQADEAAAADFVIVDAADPAACRSARERGLLGRAIALGLPECQGVLMQLPRPLNLMLVVRALDEIVVRGVREPVAAAAAPATQPTVAAPSEPNRIELRAVPTVPDMAPPAGKASPRKSRAYATTLRADLADEPTAVETSAKRGSAAMDHILVVDDSDIALRFMASHLQRFGFQIHLAQSGEEALERVAERHFEFVFMDVMMEGLDGFQACKGIKRATYQGNRRPPTVVMLTSRGTAVDKLRGTMAGADAYLTKPLREVELLKVIGEREVERHAYAETGVASTML
jgi:two-component system, cell cycle response regulator